MACSQTKRSEYKYDILPISEAMPRIVDGSPLRCPECASVNGQKMFKMSHRDFRSIKNKLIQLRDERDYLLELLESNQ